MKQILSRAFYYILLVGLILNCAIILLLACNINIFVPKYEMDLKGNTFLAKEKNKFGEAAVTSFKSYNHLFFIQDRKFSFLQAVYNKDKPLELGFPYYRLITNAVTYSKKADDILLIGLGGGRINNYLAHYFKKSKFDIVELDRVVIDFAKKYFDVKETENIHIINQDGVDYLNEVKKTYDIIIIDVHDGEKVPLAFTNTEFVKLLKEKVGLGGVVAYNLPCSPDYENLKNSIKAMFKYVEAYKLDNNIVLFAYNHEESSLSLFYNACSLQVQKRFNYSLPAMFLITRFGKKVE